jgi:hypothetical protein
MLVGGFGTTGSGRDCKGKTYEARVDKRELIEHCCREGFWKARSRQGGQSKAWREGADEISFDQPLIPNLNRLKSSWSRLCGKVIPAAALLRGVTHRSE